MFSPISRQPTLGLDTAAGMFNRCPIQSYLDKKRYMRRSRIVSPGSDPYTPLQNVCAHIQLTLISKIGIGPQKKEKRRTIGKFFFRPNVPDAIPSVKYKQHLFDEL